MLEPNQPLRVFIGYDSAEPVAYHVCCQSILENTNHPVSFFPIGLKNKPTDFERPRGDKDSTEFAITRFLVPYLSNYEGFSIFMDCDMLVRGDIAKLFDEVDPKKAISVAMHNYIPKTKRKFLNQEQSKYQRKNWSSVIVFNNARCKQLTLDFVSKAPGLDLHQFAWIDDDQIGELSTKWNHLVGEYPESDDAYILHYTLGGPYFSEYKDCNHAADWFSYHRLASRPLDG